MRSSRLDSSDQFRASSNLFGLDAATGVLPSVAAPDALGADDVVEISVVGVAAYAPLELLFGDEPALFICPSFGLYTALPCPCGCILLLG